MMASNEINWNNVLVDNEGHDLRFSMTVKNFLNYVCEPGEYLESLQMDCTKTCGTKWVLRIRAFGESEEKKDEIGVFLKLLTKPTHAESVTATFEIYLVGQSGIKAIIGVPCNVVEKSLRLGYGYVCLITRSMIIKNKDRYLPNGHLTIRCEGKEFLQKPHQTLKIEKLPENASQSQYSELVKKIYEESICSDIILKTESSEFKCHKAILAGSSNYFKAMFGHEKKENRIIVVDLSKYLNGEELKALLDYIYLRKPQLVNLSLASLQTLYQVSDMYEIGGLAEVCETDLIGQLNCGNAMELLIFSDQFGAKRLKKAAATAIANS